MIAVPKFILNWTAPPSLWYNVVMTYRKHGWQRGNSLDLDHPAALEELFDQLGETLPVAVSWTPVHCINPEHEDDNESASVNPGLGAYRCHGCGLSGDAFALAQRLALVASFKDAVALLTDNTEPRYDGKPQPQGLGRRDWL